MKCERDNGRVLQLACLLHGRRRRRPAGRRSQETNVPASRCRHRWARPRRVASASRRRRRETREGGVRRETGRGGGPEGTKSRACAGNNLACVVPPLLKPQLLWAKERGSLFRIVLHGVGMFSRCCMFHSLSLLGYERLGARKKGHPAATACALRGHGRRRFVRECSSGRRSLDCGKLPLYKRRATSSMTGGAATCLAAT